MSVRVIESTQNSRIKALAALCSKKGRQAAGRFTVEGVRLVRDAMFADSVSLHSLAVLDSRAEDKPVAHLVAACKERRIPILLVTDKVMKKISRMETPQGVVAEISLKSKLTPADADFKGMSILAHDIQDPRNMGLLLRTAEAAGVKAFFTSARATDPFHPTVIQTSMGAVFHQHIIADADSAEVIDLAKKNGASIVGAVVRNGIPAEQWLITAPRRFLLVLGNEGAGLDPKIASRIQQNITLPMWGKTESLNVAVAAGVFLYLARLAGGNTQKPAHNGKENPAKPIPGSGTKYHEGAAWKKN